VQVVPNPADNLGVVQVVIAVSVVLLTRRRPVPGGADHPAV
jgi:hypothetical protein